jgi:hypothetical protein
VENDCARKDGLYLGSRSDTEFFVEPGFQKALKSLDISSRAKIMVLINRFQEVWRETTEDLPAGYDFKIIDRNPTIHQIRLGSDYRAILMFLNGIAECHWITVFKKGNQAQGIASAKLQARALWNERGEK